MDYDTLNKCSFQELKKMAKDMGLKLKKSKKEYIQDITSAFKEYENYKKNKIDKYKKIKQLGNKGKDGITYLVENDKQKIYAMKTFKKSKSSNKIKLEYALQKKAALVGVSPRVVEFDTVSNYIVMEKMSHHLIEDMNNQDKTLSKNQQLRILDIYRKLDNIGVFHDDSNILNYMIKDDQIYIIDFGFSKQIDERLIKKLGTKNPNLNIMTLDLIIKLKELNYNPYSWKYLKNVLSEHSINKLKF